MNHQRESDKSDTHTLRKHASATFQLRADYCAHDRHAAQGHHQSEAQMDIDPETASVAAVETCQPWQAKCGGGEGNLVKNLFDIVAKINALNHQIT